MLRSMLEVEPETIEVEEGHFVKCHLYDPEHAPKDPEVWQRVPRPPAECPRGP